jgi:hypothetical protein
LHVGHFRLTGIATPQQHVRGRSCHRGAPATNATRGPRHHVRGYFLGALPRQRMPGLVGAAGGAAAASAVDCAFRRCDSNRELSSAAHCGCTPAGENTGCWQIGHLGRCELAELPIFGRVIDLGEGAAISALLFVCNRAMPDKCGPEHERWA